MRQPIIKTIQLSKHYGQIAALDRLDLEMPEGEWLAVMGPSGSGKTTLMNLIALLDAPTSGHYELLGQDTSAMSADERTVLRRERVGLIFQQFHLIPHLSAVENVMLAQYFHSVTDRDEAEAALVRVGMGHRRDHLPSQLSGGEKQRVCIARALINDPPLILADEPTGNLDAENEANVIQLLKNLHEEGRTILLITHNPQVAACADRILRLEHGRVSSLETGDSYPERMAGSS